MSAAAFERGMARGDLELVTGTLAEHVRLFSPTVHRPVEGREAVRAVLAAVLDAVSDFRYVGRLDGRLDERNGCGVHGLLFRGIVGGLEVHGVDLLELGEDDLVEVVTVMVRPLNALVALKDAVQSRVAASRCSVSDPPRTVPAAPS